MKRKRGGQTALVESIDKIWWKSIIVPSDDIIKILDGKKQAFIFRERYGKAWPKRRFWNGNFVFVRELWHPDFFHEGGFIYEADKKYKWVNWNPPQQMPREAGRIYLQIVKINRCRIKDLSLKQIKLDGCNSRSDFVSRWNERYWRHNDSHEANPMVSIYEFRKIHIKRYGGGNVIKSWEQINAKQAK